MLDPKLKGFDGADVVVEPNIDLGASAVGVAGAALLVDIPAPPNENNFDGSAGLSLTGEPGVVLNVFVAPFPNTFDVVVVESNAGVAGVEPKAGVVVEPNPGVVEPNAGVVAAEPNAGVVVVELLPNAEGAAVFPKADVVVPLATGVVPNADVVLPNAVKGDFGASLVSVGVEADGVAPNAGAAVVLPNILNADFGASFVSVAPEAGGAPNAGAVVVVLPNPPNTDLGASFVSVAPDPDAFDGAPNGVGADVEAAVFAKRFPPVNPVFPNADFEASGVVVG